MRTQKFTISVLFILSLLIGTKVLAGDKKTALTINGKSITLDQLQEDYNNRIVVEGETFQDFMDSYILKKLILEEAINQKTDTTESFKREYKIYQQQLLDSFLSDTIAAKSLINRIAERFSYELELNHIYVPFNKELIFPKDTVATYKEALDQRETAIKKGFPKNIQSDTFGIIMEPATQSGYLGWIRPLMFPLEMDDIIFSLELGDISNPIRGKTGYHIFQVTNKRPAQGVPVVEQVMFNFPVIPADRKTQDSVYNVAIKTYDEIEVRNNFQEICDEFATTFKTGDRGCLLGRVSIGEKIPYPLIQAAYELKDTNEVSRPILTDYGYHILRLKEKLSPPTEQRIKQVLLQQINEPSILPLLSKEKRKNLASETDIKYNKKAINELFELAEEFIPHDSIFSISVKNKSATLFTIAKKNSYTTQEFLDYIQSSSWIYKQETSEEAIPTIKPVVNYTLSTDILKNYLDGFIHIKAMQHKKHMVEQENVTYKKALRDLTDGLLYTNLMDQNVWKKVKTDKVGLQETFLKNKNKYKLDGEYFKGMIIHSKEEMIIKEIEKLPNNQTLTPKELRSKYNLNGMNIDIDTGLWKQGDNDFVDTKVYHSSNKKGRRNFPYYTVIGKFISEPVDFYDVKAQVERDYRKEVEQKWFNELKRKYEVDINESVVKILK